MLPPAPDSVAIAPRSAENSWRKVLLDPLGVGCACVHAASPSWNATQVGSRPAQYATVMVVGGGGGGGVDGNVPSEQALTAAISNRTQDLVDMERLREGRRGICESRITSDLTVAMHPGVSVG